jgi:hypothetical protein
MNLRKAFAPALAVLLLIGVGLAVDYSVRDKKQSGAASRRAANRVTVKVLTGSEKEKFLSDPELAKVLDEEGIRLPFKRPAPAKSRLARYGAGSLGWPRNELAQLAEGTELSTEQLAQQVHKLVGGGFVAQRCRQERLCGGR